MRTIKLVTFADNMKNDFIFEVGYDWLKEKLSKHFKMSVDQFLKECTHYDTEEIYQWASDEKTIISCEEVEAEV